MLNSTFVTIVQLCGNKNTLTLPYLTMEVSEAKGFLSSKIRTLRMTGIRYKNLVKALTAPHPTQAPQHVPEY